MLNYNETQNWITGANPFMMQLSFTPGAGLFSTTLDFSRVLNKRKGVIQSIGVYILNRSITDEFCYWTLRQNNNPFDYAVAQRAGQKDFAAVKVGAGDKYIYTHYPNYIIQPTLTLLTLFVDFVNVNTLITGSFTLEGYTIK